MRQTLIIGNFKGVKLLKNSKKRLDFLPNTLNKYSIRKFTVGTASILVGATLFLGVSNEAEAAEKEQASTTIDTNEAQDVKAKGHVQTSESATLSQVKPCLLYTSDAADE